MAEYEEDSGGVVDAGFEPQLRLHGADALSDGRGEHPLLCSGVLVEQQQEERHLTSGQTVSTDVQQLLVVKEEVSPEQQELSLSLDQDPEPPHIKEEQDDFWPSQEGEQLQGLEEADIKFPFTSVSVKSEDDEEEGQSSQLHERQTENREAEPLKTEADGEDCGGSEPAQNSDPDGLLQPGTHDETSPSSESETDDSRDWEETEEHQSGSKSDMEGNTGKTSVSSKRFLCSVCGKTFKQKIHLKEHLTVHTGEKPFNCSVCGRGFARKTHLREHSSVHTGEKPFSCSICGKRFARETHLRRHSTVHTEERPFSCSVCGKRFTRKTHLKAHMTVHTGEKTFSCSVCSKRFSLYNSLRRHLAVHTGEKPFSCSVCGKSFTQHSNLRHHLIVHTGEKPFSCSVCDKRFTLNHTLKQHLRVHTGERFTCSVCNKRFTRRHKVKNHKCVGESSRKK